MYEIPVSICSGVSSKIVIPVSSSSGVSSKTVFLVVLRKISVLIIA